MNYYQRHLGDYARDTAHLSMLEHGAYSVLLDRYYSDEAGLDPALVHRWARARSVEEVAAVDAVLAEFFRLVGGVWTHRRADEEIAKAQVRMVAARDNGKRGGRPRLTSKPSNNPLGLHSEPDPNPAQTQVEALHTPVTNNQKKQDQKTAPKGVELADVDPKVAADFKALRTKQRAPITETAVAGIEREARKAGITLEEALRTCCERGWRGFKAEWITNNNQNGASHAAPVRLSAVERVRANAIAGELADRAAAERNGIPYPVGPHD